MRADFGVRFIFGGKAYVRLRRKGHEGSFVRGTIVRVMLRMIGPASRRFLGAIVAEVVAECPRGSWGGFLGWAGAASGRGQEAGWAMHDVGATVRRSRAACGGEAEAGKCSSTKLCSVCLRSTLSTRKQYS